MGQEVHPIINAFNNGEGSPLLDGRTDLAKYKSLNKTVENFLVSPHGPVMNCPGFKYIAETKDSTAQSRLIPFKFSASQTYVLEFGNLYVRFYKDQAQLGAPFEIVTPYTTSQLAAIKFAQSADVMYLVHPDHAPRKLLRFGDTDWELRIVNFFPPPLETQKTELSATLTLASNAVAAAFVTVTASAAIFKDGDIGKEIREKTADGTGRGTIGAFISTTQVQIIIFSIFSDQSAPFTVVSGTWELVGTSNKPISIISDPSDGIGHLDQCLSLSDNFSSDDSGKYLSAFGGIWFIDIINAATNISMILIKPRSDNPTGQDLARNGDTDGATGSITNITDTSIYSVGSYVSISSGFAGFRPHKVIGVGSTGITVKELSTGAVVGVVIIANVGTEIWSVKEPMWSASKGYPSAITFHENRLWFGGTASFPDTIWGSAIGDYENFALGTGASDAVQFTFTAREINLIKWLESGNSLLGGTLGGEWRVASSDVENAPITPTDVSVKMQTNYGSADIQPISIGSELIFISKFGDKLRSVSFDSTIDSFISPEISILSEHLLKGGISEIAYQKEPFSTLWMVRADGQLVGMSHVKEQDSTSFFRRTTGTSDEFESITVIPGASYDELWAIVKRTINGATVRYIEVMQKVFDSEDDLTDSFFVDAGVSYSGVATTTITGLDHLEGETVKVLANGSAHTDEVVSGGQITLDWESTTATVGIGYNSTLVLNRLDAGAVDGTAQGRVKAVKKHNVRFYRTVNALIGMEDTDIDKMARIRMRDDRITGPNDPTPLFTGDKLDIPNVEGYETKGRIKIIQDQPLPMTIIAMMPEVEEE